MQSEHIGHSFDHVPDIGTGIWWSLHMAGFLVHEPNGPDWDHFLWIVNMVRRSFPGKSCKDEFQKFFETRPLDSYKGKSFRGRFSGAFEWTVEAHNEVNKRNKIPLVTLEEAWDRFERLERGETKNCKMFPDQVPEPSIMASRPSIRKRFMLPRASTTY